MQCINCHNELEKNTNICPVCGQDNTEIDEEFLRENMESVVNKFTNSKGGSLFLKIFKIVLFAPIIFICFVSLCTIIMNIVGYFSEHIKAKNYTDVIGQFYKIDCDKDELCKGYYKYVVDDVEYVVSPSKLTNSDDFLEKETVWYNPTNPSESLIYVDWFRNILFDIITFVILTVVIIGSKKGKLSVKLK